MKLLVTGVAGFIGSALTKALLARGDTVVGLDNLNQYYDVELKQARLKLISEHPDFTFIQADITDRETMSELFATHSFDTVVHLAAQAGVRYAAENPYAYIDTNLVGFGHILENCRQQTKSHLVYASSSSVYGANELQPFAESHGVNHPVSLYAATKKANELMAHSYAHLYQIACTGLRFFTVYGPWGRPDMALFKFTKAILAGEPIDVYNNGHMQRDFTYIDDVLTAMMHIIDNPAKPDPAWDGQKPNPALSYTPYRIYNIGNSHPISLMQFIEAIERHVGRKAIKRMMALQPGDVPQTHADVNLLQADFSFKPQTSIDDGVARFVDWYCSYYQ